jgi:hypothetical protein
MNCRCLNLVDGFDYICNFDRACRSVRLFSERYSTTSFTTCNIGFQIPFGADTFYSLGVETLHGDFLFNWKT